MKAEEFKKLKLFLLLNHTSLYEPILIGAFPNALLWEMAKRFVYPVAEKTMNSPIAGTIFRLFAPHTVSISRRRDHTWDRFMGKCSAKNSLIGIAPEGRMKRPTGLDKSGRPMNMKSGVSELLSQIDSGGMLLLYSGGLHHIQSPGSGLPKLFRRIRLRFEFLDIEGYKESFCRSSDPATLAKRIILDLEKRRDRHCSYGSHSSQAAVPCQSSPISQR